MYFIKALSHVEDAPAARKRWLTEAEEQTSQKFFPQNYEELQVQLQALGEYRTPLPVPCMFEDYDWDNAEYTVFVVLTIQKPSGEWLHFIFSEARIFMMNNDGKTIDTIRI
ncbi:hypothetical protein LCGC14_0738450 [marine sediment metagenome]|uniref:Uncharacterized protein n=1 Tax=marine sediment metagenome TaxID=412755 RepID=A0A0F9QBM5_9ZZZZ